jgi:hypothetical protein
MSIQLLFYHDAAPVNPSRHKDLYIKSGREFGFARTVSSVPLTAMEFPMAAPEYAIVFAGNDDVVFPVVILGGEQNQNLYLNEDDTWKARYVPAFVRRYPFVFSQVQNDDRLTLCIDEHFAGCNRDGRGERLFDADGEQTAYLAQVLKFLQAYQVQHQRTVAFCNKLKSLDLLQPVNATLNADGGNRRVLTGLQVVNRARLNTLEDAQIAEMLRADELETVFYHLHSLANLRLIGERLPPAAPSEETAPKAESTEAETSASTDGEPPEVTH